MIYIHFPFCKSFCTYCDFYSVRERDRMEAFRKSLLREISARKASFMDCDGPDTLYFGGGTPSLFPAGELEEIIGAVRTAQGRDGRKKWFEELTVEVNPDDITSGYALALRRAGVSRISMGVQSFSDASLRWMNRRHTASTAADAYKTLRAAGFDNISLDLIFGYDPVPWGSRPTEGEALLRLWREDVSMMVELRPEHVSAYQMGVEEGSVLGGKAAAGLYREPDEDVCAVQYALLQQLLSEAGYEQYEVSNFALPGYRALHNSGYWDRHPYIGLGPGAHSFDGDRCRSWNLPDMERYISYWSSGGTGEPPGETETLSDEDVAVETVMLGLRKVSGLGIVPPEDGAGDGKYHVTCGPGTPVVSLAQTAVDRLLSAGALVREQDRIFIPPAKLFVSDSVIRDIVSEE